MTRPWKCGLNPISPSPPRLAKPVIPSIRIGENAPVVLRLHVVLLLYGHGGSCVSVKGYDHEGVMTFQHHDDALHGDYGGGGHGD